MCDDASVLIVLVTQRRCFTWCHVHRDPRALAATERSALLWWWWWWCAGVVDGAWFRTAW
jgi:hypothetical protein